MNFAPACIIIVLPSLIVPQGPIAPWQDVCRCPHRRYFLDRLSPLIVCGFLLVAFGAPTTVAQAEGLSPEEALARFELPPGFRLQLFSSEPTIRQPVSMTFDACGRMWVIQYLQYPNPAGADCCQSRSVPAHQIRSHARAAAAWAARRGSYHDSRRLRRRWPCRHGERLRRRAESGDRPGHRPRRRVRRAGSVFCFSTPIATATMSPMATPKSCSPASAWKTRMRWRTACNGAQTVGSTAHKGAR